MCQNIDSDEIFLTAFSQISLSNLILHGKKQNETENIHLPSHCLSITNNNQIPVFVPMTSRGQWYCKQAYVISRQFPLNLRFSRELWHTAMLSPEQYRIRTEQRLAKKREQEKHLQRSSSDTESEPIYSSTSLTGKRVTSFDLQESRLLQLSDELDGRSSERSISPAMESFLNSSDDDRGDWTASASMISDDISRSTTISESQSTTLSMYSSVSRRPNRSAFATVILQPKNIEDDLKRKCRCERKTGISCHSSFSFGDVSQLRYLRSKLDQSMDRERRLVELKSALLHPEGKVSVGCDTVKYRMCCITSYYIAFGIPKASIYRALSDLRRDVQPNLIGRRKKTDADRVDDELIGPTSAMQLHAQAWLKIWLDHEGDVDPTGEEQTFTIDMVDVRDIYNEYVSEWRLNAVSNGANAISERDFNRVWKFVMNDARVRIREKKNMTTKCSGNY